MVTTPVFLVHIEITHAQVKIERVPEIPGNVFEFFFSQAGFGMEGYAPMFLTLTPILAYR